MATIIFHGQDLVVRSNLKGTRDRLVITFDFWRDRPDDRRTGFCERMLEGFEVDAIHIISTENHWFQTPELTQVFALVRPIAMQYQKVIGFGSSMGAHGALHYAAHMGAELVLALSPIFSIRKGEDPFDNRWPHDTHVIIKHRPVIKSKFPRLAIAFYDPYNEDAKHVALFKARMSLQEVRMPFAGHPCTHTLVDTGLLYRVLLSVIDGSFDADLIIQEWRKVRGRSGHYLNMLAGRSRSETSRRTLKQKAEALPGWLPPSFVQVPRDEWRPIAPPKRRAWGLKQRLRSWMQG